jgi:DNA-binding LacI/PurR family transcriptional regulator
MQFNGYCTTLCEHGIVVDENLVAQEKGVLLEASRPSLTLLDLSKQPTAIFCLNDMTVIGLINEFQ